MRKEIKLAFLIFIGFLAFLGLKNPLSSFLIAIEIGEIKSDLISGLVVRGILLVVMIFIIARLKLKRFLGLDSIKIYNIRSVLIALLFIAIGVKTNWKAYMAVESSILYLFIASVLFVGLIEEFVFRGAIFPLFLRSFRRKKRVLLISAILSSLLFGLIHYINLFSEPTNYIGISSQVFFAFAVGIFFTGIMLRTKNIIVPVLLHGLINFAFGSGDLTNEMTESTSEVGEIGFNWSSIIPTTFFFLFILAGGIYMIKKTTKEEVLLRLCNGKSTATNISNRCTTL